MEMVVTGWIKFGLYHQADEQTQRSVNTIVLKGQLIAAHIFEFFGNKTLTGLENLNHRRVGHWEFAHEIRLRRLHQSIRDRK